MWLQATVLDITGLRMLIGLDRKYVTDILSLLPLVPLAETTVDPRTLSLCAGMGSQDPPCNIFSTAWTWNPFAIPDTDKS